MIAQFLFFDLDDTILRFSAGQPDFWQLALAAEPSLGVAADVLRRAVDPVSDAYWGDPAQAFYGRLNMHQARRDIALGAWSALGIERATCLRLADHVTDAKEDHVRPFDGAIEALHALRGLGHRLALLTNGSSAFQRRKLERYALAPLFELVLVEGELGFGKPDARVFRRALDHFGIAASEACMIGDNLEADIKAAQTMGLRTLWHDAYGTGLPQNAPCRPDGVLRELGELLPR